MTELAEQLTTWLKTLKLPVEPRSTTDFSNGYLFGEIFGKLHLRKNKQYHNKQDLTCTFHNYKNTRELLLENWGIEFPVDNLINKSQELLTIIKECVTRNGSKNTSNATRSNNTQVVNQNNKTSGNPIVDTAYQSIKKGLTSKLGQSVINVNSVQDLGFTSSILPKKIIDIESKLQKYRDEKIKHQLLALQERRKEMDFENKVIQDHREYQRNKLRNNHEFIKTMDDKIYEDWKHSETIKAERIERDRKFQEFMNMKKQAVKQRIRDQDQKDFKDGLQLFSTNCLKLGIDLEKDLEKIIVQQKERKPEKQFNNVAFLERIADKNRQREEGRKDKIKRENNTNIEQKDAQAKAGILFAEQSLVQKYSKLVIEQAKSCKELRRQRAAEQHEYQLRKSKENYKTAYKIQFDQEAQKKRQEQYRLRKIVYMEQNLQEKLRKREKHNNKIAEVIMSILNVVEDCYSEQRRISKQNGTEVLDLPYRFWIEKMSKFVEGSSKEVLRLDKSLSGLAHSKSKLGTSAYMGAPAMRSSEETISENIVETLLHDYLQKINEWIVARSVDFNPRNQSLSQKLTCIIESVHPEKAPPTKSTLPLHMPLRIAITGSTFSGRKTQAEKLSKKYGLVVIDPYETVKEALALVAPAPPEDQKKAGKKDSKKPEDEPIKPSKQLMIDFGNKIKLKISDASQATIQMLIQAFGLKLNQNFSNKTLEEVFKQFKESQRSSTERFTQMLKDFQEAQKKKKDPKKPNQPEEPPQPPKYPYTEGFVLVGLNAEQLGSFQKYIGGFIPQSERINAQAQKLKQQCSLLFYVPPKVPDNHLHAGMLDYIFVLDCKQSHEVLEVRNEGRKLDPVTNIVYHVTLNPPPNDVKGLNQRLIALPLSQIQHIQTEKLQKIYCKHGYQGTQIKTLKIMKDIGSMTVEDIHRSIDEHLDILLNYKTSKLRNGQSIGLEQENPQKDIVFNQTSTKGNSFTEILKSLKETILNYRQDMESCLGRFSVDRGQFLVHFEDIIKSFLDILLRPDDKMMKILSFQDTYNKLLTEQEGLLQIEQAKRHLIEKLDNMYDGMWDNICAKKDEAINHRAAVLKSQWLEQESIAVVNGVERLIQIELNRTTQILEFAMNIELSEAGKELIQIGQHITIDSIDPKTSAAPNVFSSTDPNSFPRFNQLYDNVLKITDEFKDWVLYKYKKAGIKENIDLDVFSDVIAQQSKKQKERIKLILQHGVSRIREYRALYSILVQRMDDWIIFGIKNQNDSAYSCVKEIKKCIAEGRKSNMRELQIIEPQEIYKPYPFLNQTHLPTFTRSIEERRMVVEDLRSLYSDWQHHNISYQLFKTYIERRIKNSLLPSYLKKPLNFQRIEQYFVQGLYIDGFEISVAMLLYQRKIPIQDEIEEMRKTLKALAGVDNSNDMNQSHLSVSVSLQQFLQCRLYIQKSATFDNQQLGLKHLIFEIFRNPQTNEADVEKMCDTFTQLSLIQVQTFCRLL